MGHLRHGLVALGLVLALAPLAAYADGNEAAIDAAKAEKAWLQNMTPMQQGVTFGQQEIANARAIAKLLYYDGHAQSEIPNSMTQYAAFCLGAIQKVQAHVDNAAAMATERPWDAHAQAELANATAQQHALWDMIGDTYAGNPFHGSGSQVTVPVSVPVYGDDSMVLADDETVMAADESVVADDASLIVAEDAADLVAN